MSNFSEKNLRAIIEVNYLKSHKIHSKIFTSSSKSGEEFSPIQSKTLKETAWSNLIQIEIEVKRFNKQFSNTISGGNYNFYTESPIGYLLKLHLERNDPQLMNRVIKTLRNYGFGCMSSEFSAHCSKAEPYPTTEGAQKIMTDLCTMIKHDLDSMGTSEVKDMEKKTGKIGKQYLLSQEILQLHKKSGTRFKKREHKKAIISVFFLIAIVGGSIYYMPNIMDKITEVSQSNLLSQVSTTEQTINNLSEQIMHTKIIPQNLLPTETRSQPITSPEPPAVTDALSEQITQSQPESQPSPSPTCPEGFVKLSDGTCLLDKTFVSPQNNPISQITQSNNDNTNYNIDALYQYALNLVNDDRKTKGLNPVALSNINSAQNHADNQLSLKYFSHWNSDGVKPYVVYTKLGGRGYVAENDDYSYSYCPTSNCIENTYDPYTEIKKAEDDMLNNDASSNWGHRDNILDSHHTHVNFGIAYDHERFYFVENFENNLVNWQTIELAGSKLIMVGTIQQGYSMDQIDVFSDPTPKTLTEQNLDNQAPYNAGHYDQGTNVGIIVPKLSGNYYYPECASGKITITSSDGSSQCLDYTTFENNSANPNSIGVSADVSKWINSDSLHTVYVNLKDPNGDVVPATSLTLEYLK